MNREGVAEQERVNQSFDEKGLLRTTVRFGAISPFAVGCVR